MDADPTTGRIDAIPRRWALERPEGFALRDGARAVTWRALVEAIDAGAGMLADAGVRRGDRVMIVAENSTALVAMLFATSSLDACAVIVNPRLSAREVDAMREHARPRRVLFATGTANEVDEHARRLGATPVDVPGAGALAMSAVDEGNSGSDSAFRNSGSDSGFPGTGVTLPDAASENPSLTPNSGNPSLTPNSGKPSLTPNSHVDPARQLAVIVYTTGTSGSPKGVMLSHANLRFVAEASAQLRDIRPKDRVYGALPIYHVYGLASVLLGSFCGGACLQVVARFDAARALDALAHDGLTIFQGVPAMYARMLERLPDGARANAPALRYLYAGGSTLDPTLKAEVERRFGCPLHNGYGLTECSPTVSQTRLDAPRADTSVGPPIPGIDVRIAAPDGSDGAAGAIGELWVRGPNVMMGYYRDPRATGEAITSDGWLKTGDLAQIGADGALSIVGRSKELIIRSGLNVHPSEVEAVLNAHPAVAQSVVVGRAAGGGNEEVVAFVELARGRAVDAQALAAHAAGQLAPYKRPAEIRIMEALPASPTGKVLRGKLKELAGKSSG